MKDGNGTYMFNPLFSLVWNIFACIGAAVAALILFFMGAVRLDSWQRKHNRKDNFGQEIR